MYKYIINYVVLEYYIILYYILFIYSYNVIDRSPVTITIISLRDH